MIIHRMFEPRWERQGQPCGRDLAFGRRCQGTLSVRVERLSAWPAHQRDPAMAVVLLPTLADRDASISDPSLGHRLGLGVCDSCSVQIPILRGHVSGRPACLSTADLWGDL